MKRPNQLLSHVDGEEIGSRLDFISRDEVLKYQEEERCYNLYSKEGSYQALQDHNVEIRHVCNA